MLSLHMNSKFIFSFGFVITITAFKLWFHSTFKVDVPTKNMFMFVMSAAFPARKARLFRI